MKTLMLSSGSYSDYSESWYIIPPRRTLRELLAQWLAWQRGLTGKARCNPNGFDDWCNANLTRFAPDEHVDADELGGIYDYGEADPDEWWLSRCDTKAEEVERILKGKP